MRNKNNYFRKSNSEIAIGILSVLILASLMTIAITSPYFIVNLLKEFKGLRKYPKKKVYDTFYRLREQGLIKFENSGGQIFISLTEKGKRKVGWMQINDLKIEKSKKWDKKWRMVMFDIAQMKRQYREALRGKLKQLGFYLFQKSIWVIPYECKKQINMLKKFFGLKDSEIRLITIDDIGEDRELRNFFKL
ncbi:MAG: hypothetical protein A2312_04440 [Candidatus Staskawiczbacteria bacterium RIFOXYB2_FULL_32_9]|uniref:Transcriptional repressor PaaX-like central Cas2-like domain-containing protein n=1 Tax=Candidatus Staskawiczbacteria bacterium RIFOXYD1_FULL_32_13 TaxID=1802234 RepID=A0A1G2JNY6_9BACT|nr:MAG: Transcriptional regulator, PaaX family [Parcubacteria group bacterium GW2011_GWC2_32_10]OGZ78466.1 MAG: hypothetical protein A2360_04175 [Candidatus Staskawiczbacteria bacterium RIFOXYB1_FULL_32_11]OGZ79729.1 MAG: hypothetical protein A2256_01255 [Candidatus Staskawiczbacteria bacterium RIFOXYA2_FULL_32_7]OGZ83762.1 MAG: hypothetical protein A2312_04440 [Candidatus Staskawiczbacteria bacterium RIFOXYB2_FULL_32_9]OGZ85850.1 MAG: hypothetical protein A2463_03145 [Candidatus Staskawiczbact